MLKGLWWLTALALTIALIPAWAQSITDTSPHKIQFVTVEPGVQLEVLDWGGNGPALVFLAGLGNAAHVFDTFAPKFTASHHVYAITRRGYGASSRPTPLLANYDATRLGEDVLAVMAALKLERPILAGHSIAGQELSYVGSRHPEHVSGLIYLDAGWPYAFYDPARGDITIDTNELRQTLDSGIRTPNVQEYRALLNRLAQHDLPRIMGDIKGELANIQDVPNSLPQPQSQQTPTQQMQVSKAIAMGENKQLPVRAPLLAFFAVPGACKPDCDKPGTKAMAADDMAQVNFVQASYPDARIVRLPYADHFVFKSDEADVIREMNAFMVGLTK